MRATVSSYWRFGSYRAAFNREMFRIYCAPTPLLPPPVKFRSPPCVIAGFSQLVDLAHGVTLALESAGEESAQ